MKAIELRIVFEDDEGKTYTQTYTDFGAKDMCSWIANRWWSNSPAYPTNKAAPIIGPVLRRVTEGTGTLHDAVLDSGERTVFMRDRGEYLRLDDLVPEGVNEESLGEGPRWAFRFDVTAVPVKP